MKTILALPVAVFAGLCAAAALAAPAADTKPANGAANGAKSAPAAPAEEARIPFAAHHGIRDWQVVDDRTLLIQGLSGTWYKATLMSRCFDLPFAERIGFKTNPDGSFDRFSAILVRHQRCPLISLVVTTPPATKKPHPKTPANPEPPKTPAATPPGGG